MIYREGPGLSAPEGLKRFLDRPRKRVGEHCEMCSEPIGETHSHVVNIQSRNLMCVCRGCYLLFTTQGAAQGRYLAVPDRYLYDPDFALTADQWEELQIPVNMAFFFMNSELGQMAAFYPSPAGATESEIDAGSWERVRELNPALERLEPDSEALIVNRTSDPHQHAIAPIDDCYRLVGMIKSSWEGISGGTGPELAIAQFFAELHVKGFTRAGDGDG